MQKRPRQSTLLDVFFEPEEPRPSSVSEINAQIKGVLESSFSRVWVEGELTGFYASSSGHWYFTLTDGDSTIKAVCYKSQNFRVRFKPFDGLQVRVRGQISLYEPRGEYQLLVDSLQPVGEGALTVAFEQIKAKLLKEGLFDESRKRPLPAFPRRVGVVTSPTGAAIHDIATVLERRAKGVSIVIIPSLVQGEFAAEQIAAGIGLANEYSLSGGPEDRIDVLIVGRGGGSAEDLWAFNDEVVARAIRASQIPVISAVGHEVDFSIADMAADVRAATPSAAAEIVAASEEEVLRKIEQLQNDMFREMSYIGLAARTELQTLAMSPVFAEFPSMIRDLRHRLEMMSQDVETALDDSLRIRSEKIASLLARLSPVRLSAKVSENLRRLSILEHRSGAAAVEITASRERKTANAMARLDAMSPLSVLTRGYSITEKEGGEIVRNVHQISVGDRLSIRVAEGKFGAEVTEVE